VELKCKIEGMFLNVIDEFNEQADEDSKLTIHPNEVLFGDQGRLDSLGLVNLITIIEEHIEDTFNITIAVADDKAMSRNRSPFRTVGSLFDYILELVEEHQNG
jgi:acyl carrier protein